MNWILLVMGAIVSVVAAVLVAGLLVPASYATARAIVLRADLRTTRAALLDLAQWPVWMELARTPRLETSTDVVVSVTVWTDDQQQAGALQFVLEPFNQGTRVVVRDRGTISNPVSRLLRHYVTGHAGTADALLRALADALNDDAVASDA
jgi:hypothetical protein